MGNQNETSDFAVASASALLDHYLSDNQNNFQELAKDTHKLNNLRKSPLPVEIDLLTSSIGRTSGNIKTAKGLLKWTNKLIKQLTRPYEDEEFTETCIQKVLQYRNTAILGHFNAKNNIIDGTTMAVASKTQILQNRSLIPQWILDIFKGKRNEDEEN